METVEKAPAKLNLGLDVRYLREDGYHELEMVMTSIDLNDYLTFSELSQREIHIYTNDGSLPLDRRNFVYQAADYLMEKFSISTGIEIEIDKNIPVAAGLGGGSSDAAATLRALNRLWELGLSLEELAKIGETIGSDVPYCVYGETAFVSGRGEKVEKIRALKPCWVLLVKPPKKVSTSSIFRQLRLEQAIHPDVRALRAAMESDNFEAMCAQMGNTLESVTATLYPEILRIKERLLSLGAKGAMMSGSGSSVFGLFQQREQALRAYNGIRGVYSEVYLVRSL